MTEQPRHPTPGPDTPDDPHPTKPTGPMARFLAVVEWLGNLLPHPVSLFALFALGVVLLSGVAGLFNWSVADPRDHSGQTRIEAVSLMTGDGLRWIVTNLVTNFTGFVPLGTVLVALLGVGVAERSGLLTAVIRGMVLAAPKNLVTVVVVFAAVISNTASEMGYVVLIPMAMVVFHALGRHPLAGLAAAFAGVSGGYSANLFIGTVDPLLSGITQEAARIAPLTGAAEYEVYPTANWFFMIGSTFLITALGTWVTARIVEPRLGRYDPSAADDSIDRNPKLDPLSPAEKRGLKWAGLAALAVLGLIVHMAGPQFWGWSVWGWEPLAWARFVQDTPLYGVLRDPVSGSLLGSPLLRGVVVLIFVFFLVPGFVYGWFTGSMRSDRDVIDAMAAAMSSMGLYIVLVFFAAQFVSFFNYTNLGSILAVLGADGIRAIGLDNPLVFIPFILMCCFVNLMLGSASAQWAVTAPIFVPMLMAVGYSPEVIQAAYRIGDSTTNIITPMMSYFGLILAFAARYDRKLGIGTLVATMLPYSIIFLIGWMIFFYLWVFILGLPVGPAAPTYFNPA